MREVILYPGEDGYWVVECPSLPGCVSQGKTKREALKNIKEAISCYTHALEEDNLPVPREKFEVSVVVV
jgi:predicted RNase H-like HicB family nuclease